ncbi:MAG: saccharopine dehydrogenase family protein [Candidatus Mcinerneyibacterium aminivorans]|uniref:Saccharopine dehydrogenase family protein n=1 Tax=Candidatus Mcinerneyibacterium aminivorans TaxID=2703815 RepID=A0A5D0MM68_9BACT|nr:MAG: saccharopine dehydrogenase family protein [Candidatus Mcinerneyibacterium aminivorans]
MNIILLGAGRIGEVISVYLNNRFDLTIVDSSQNNLKKLENYGKPKKCRINNKNNITELIKNYDLVIGCLPGKLGLKTMKACMENQIDLIDLSFMPEDSLSLDEEAKKNNITIIPDAGFAPGLSNLFAGRLYQKFDEIDEIGIRVGGLPIKKKSPLYYKITWSPHDLISEYIRNARLIKNNEIIEIDPLEIINKVRIKNNDFEEFFSDGLRTLLSTLDISNLWETTLRWEGHLNKIKILRDLNFFNKENLQNTLKIISPLMDYESKDFSIMEVIGYGKINNKKREIKYYLYDEEKNGLSSMSRVTGFTAGIIVETFIKYSDEFENGVIPPEIIGKNKNLHDEIVDKLKQKDIHIEYIL